MTFTRSLIVAFPMLTIALAFLLLFDLRQLLTPEDQQQAARRRTRRSVDMSHRRTPPPEALQPAIQELRSLGFRYLGEVAVVETDAFETRNLGTSWVFSNAEDDTHAEVTPTPWGPGCGFTTMFADEAVAQVFYPRGESVDEPDFVHHANSGSITAAYRQQQAQVEALRPEHGAPRRTTTVADCIAIAEIYREKHFPRLRRRVQKRSIKSPLIPLIDLAVLVSIAGLWYGWQAMAWPRWFVLPGLIIILGLTAGSLRVRTV